MRITLLAIAALALPFSVRGEDDFATLVKRGDAFDAQLKTKDALEVYLQAEKLQPNDADLLHKIAKQYGESMDDYAEGDKAPRKVVAQKSLDYSKRAVAADAKNATAHLALAVAYGRIAPLLDNKTKIAYSKFVKDEVDKSIALNAKNDLAYHVLGAWNYELANLNPILRAVAKLIYGELPAASNQDAVKAFRKAIELNPKRVGNYVELGRTYAELGEKDLAKAAIEKGLALPNTQRDDDGVKARGREALRKL